jgi:hypothetical protein
VLPLLATPYNPILLLGIVKGVIERLTLKAGIYFELATEIFANNPIRKTTSEDVHERSSIPFERGNRLRRGIV